MCAIEIMESVLVTTTLMVNSCDNISALRRATIRLEEVKPRWKQVDLISSLSDVYQSMYSGMYLVFVYGHYNRRRPESTLTPLASLNLRMDALAEHIMAEFLLSSATRNTIAIGLLDPHGIPSVSIHGAPFHSNIAQSVAYEISKLRLLQHWDNWNLTHTVDWDKIDLSPFKRA